jgi:hypothetical protein
MFAVARPRKVVGCTCDHAFLQKLNTASSISITNTANSTKAATNASNATKAPANALNATKAATNASNLTNVYANTEGTFAYTIAGTGMAISGMKFDIDASGGLFFPFSYVRRSGILHCTKEKSVSSSRRAVPTDEHSNLQYVHGRRQVQESNTLSLPPLSVTESFETPKVCFCFFFWFCVFSTAV